MGKKAFVAGIIIAGYLIFALISPHLLNESAIENWHYRTYWVDYPTLAPPEWVNLFGKNLPPTENVSGVEVAPHVYEMKYSFTYSEFPPNLKIKFPSKPEGNVIVNMTTPEGETYTLYEGPILEGPVLELNFGKDASLIRTFTGNMGLNLTFEEIMMAAVSGEGIKFLFGKKVGDSWEPVKGEYTFTVKSSVKPYMWVTGRVYGVMGTDAYGRDIWQAFLAGTRQTLALVIITAFSAVSLGIILGLLGSLSNLAGKVVDGLSKVSGMLPSIPLLVAIVPLVSTVGYYGNLQIPMWAFVLALSLILFGKISQNVKAMVTVEMAKEYVESSRSLGASELWILRKHVLRTLTPYAASQFVLISAKTVALVSLLGFFSVVPGMNWGTLMAMIIVQKALYYKAWWMVVPVGVAISLLAIAFILLNMEIEERREGFIA